MRKVLVLVMIFPIIFTGCWDQKIFEKIAYVLEIGVEPSKNEGKFLITATAPAIGAKEKYGVEILTTTAESFRESRENFNRMASRKIVGGKTQQILVSEEVAKKGTNELLEIFTRDPELPNIPWIVIVEGSPKEMFEKASKFKDIPGPALYINQLIQDNVKDFNVPETRLYNFNINYFAKGADPVTPILRLEAEDILAVGSAVFSDDKMVGKLNHKDTSMMLSMMGKVKNSELSYIAPLPQSLPSEGKDNFAVTLTKCKSNTNVKIESGRPVVDISLSFTAIVEEYGWDKLNKESTQKILENTLEESIKNDCTRVLEYLKKVGSDPIGIGEKVRAGYYDFWNNIDWKSAYKTSIINVTPHVDIKEYGIIN